MFSWIGNNVNIGDIEIYKLKRELINFYFACLKRTAYISQKCGKIAERYLNDHPKNVDNAGNYQKSFLDIDETETLQTI